MRTAAMAQGSDTLYSSPRTLPGSVFQMLRAPFCLSDLRFLDADGPTVLMATSVR